MGFRLSVCLYLSGQISDKTSIFVEALVVNLVNKTLSRFYDGLITQKSQVICRNLSQVVYFEVRSYSKRILGLFDDMYFLPHDNGANCVVNPRMLRYVAVTHLMLR